MKRFRNLLVVCGDDPMATRSLLKNAVGLARSTGAAVTAFSVVGDLEGHGRRKRKAVGREARNALVRSRLDELMEMGRIAGLTGSYQVVAGVPHVKVLDRVAVHGHDLVMLAGDSERQKRGRTTLPMQLLRKCDAPVWVHAPHVGATASIAVAVGPLGAGKSTEDLNVKLLELGASLARTRAAQLQVVHAWRLDGDSMLSSRRLSYPWAEIDAMSRTVVAEARAEIDWLIDRAGVSRSDVRLHIQNGHPADVMTRAARDLNPEVIVMGTLARSGIPGLMIGNTVERLVDSVGRTVLAVKPDGFTVPAPPKIDWDPAMLPY